MNITDVLQILNNFIEWLKQADRASPFWTHDLFPFQFQAAINVVEQPPMYRAMTAEQGHDLALVALTLFDLFTQWQETSPIPLHSQYEYLPHIIFINLANGVPGALTGLYAALLQRNLGFVQNSIFREAEPKIRDELITLILSGKRVIYHPVDLFVALAWIGDEVVQSQFQRWREDPPSCSAWMDLPPEGFTLCAGWELTPDGKRRNLYFQENHDIVPLAQAEAAGLPLPGPLVVAALQEERCGWCNRPLMALFDIDLRDPRMAFLGLQGERLRIPICLNCSFPHSQDEHVFMDVNWFGGACWSPLNGERPADLCIYTEDDISYIKPFPPPPFVLGAVRRTPYESAGAHLGGCPDWVQDADYPHCPVCQQTMVFLGQHDLDNVDIFGLEGYLYAFLCIICQKSTIVQQQT